MNRKAFLRLMAEMRDDESQRVLRDKGVLYTDDRNALKEILDGKIQEPEPSKSMDDLERGGIER